MNPTGISLNNIDEKRLVLLAKLIDTGSNQFRKPIQLTELSLKQQLLYLNFAAVNNYSEGIYKLCADLRPFPAIVVLRSIVEAFINTGYILTHNSDKRAILFTMEDSYYRNGLVKEIIVFLNKHPKFETSDFNRTLLKKAFGKIDLEIELYKKKFKINYASKDDFKKDYHTSLLERAKSVDKRLKSPNFEHAYILAYRYFSEFGHLSMRGLDHFVVKDEKGNHEVIASQHSEVGHIISMTYVIYLYFLSELKKKKMLGRDFPLQKFDREWKQI